MWRGGQARASGDSQCGREAREVEHRLHRSGFALRFVLAGSWTWHTEQCEDDARLVQKVRAPSRSPIRQRCPPRRPKDQTARTSTAIAAVSNERRPSPSPAHLIASPIRRAIAMTRTASQLTTTSTPAALITSVHARHAWPFNAAANVPRGRCCGNRARAGEAGRTSGRRRRCWSAPR